MSLRKLGAVLIAVIALSAIAVSSASAAATTTAAQWYTKATPSNVETTLTSAKTLTLSVGNDSEVGEKFQLKTELTSKNTPVTLTATKASCVGCTIENKEVTSKAGKVAYGTGKIRFENVTVSTPENCTVAEEGGTPTGQVTTKALTVHADFMNGTTAVQQFFPTTGETFATFELIGSKCGVTGLYAVKGKLFTNALNPTGTAAASQSARVSPKIEEEDGGGLTIGSKALNLTGTEVLSIGGEDFLIK